MFIFRFVEDCNTTGSGVVCVVYHFSYMLSGSRQIPLTNLQLQISGNRDKYSNLVLFQRAVVIMGAGELPALKKKDI